MSAMTADSQLDLRTNELNSNSLDGTRFRSAYGFKVKKVCFPKIEASVGDGSHLSASVYVQPADSEDKLALPCPTVSTLASVPEGIDRESESVRR
jgi:hypothetical protein